MVRLEHGARCLRKRVLHRQRRHAHVRPDEQGRGRVGEEVADGVGGVMRDGEARHLDLADGERLGRLEHAPAVLHASQRGDGVGRVAVRVERHLRMALVEGGDALAVVRVVVREEYCRHVVGPHTAGRHAPLQLAAGEAAVEQQKSPA